MQPQDLNEPGAARSRRPRGPRSGRRSTCWIEGGTLVDVATGELRPADIGLVGPPDRQRAFPGHDPKRALRIDARGRFIAPGLIDTHLHIESSMVTPRRYAAAVVPQGTTTICWDPHELANVMGIDGVRWAVAASRATCRCAC